MPKDLTYEGLWITSQSIFIRISILGNISGMWRKQHWQEERGRNRPGSKKARGLPSPAHSVQENKGIIPFQGVIKLLFFRGSLSHTKPRARLHSFYYPSPTRPSPCLHLSSLPHDSRSRAQWSWWAHAAQASWEGSKQRNRVKRGEPRGN